MPDGGGKTQPDCSGENWDQTEGPVLLLKKCKVMMSFRQHPLECTKCCLGAFSLKEAKTRGFPCSASKPAAVASLWGNTSPKCCTGWYVPCPCLAALSVAELGTLGWDASVPPVPSGHRLSPYFGNSGSLILGCPSPGSFLGSCPHGGVQ